MTPVVEEEHPKISIPIRRRRTVDHDAPEYPFPRLKVVVGMVPRRAILGRPPGVGDRLSRCHRALGDRRHAVHCVGIVLANAMEVQARPVVRKAVGDMHFDSVPPIRLDRWPRNAPVHRKDLTSVAVGRSGDVGELESVFNRGTSIRHYIVVIRADVVIAPCRPIAGRVARACTTRAEAWVRATQFDWYCSADELRRLVSGA